MANFNIDDYVDVAERIDQFYQTYPEGRLCTGSHPFIVTAGGMDYIWYHARAFRTENDPLPGEGWAAEPVPGKTAFTKDSELMNAETAAWGRAIVALGFATKKIASKQEVQARTEGVTAEQEAAVLAKEVFGGNGKAKVEVLDPDAPLTDGKRTEVLEYAEKAGFEFVDVASEMGFDVNLITNAKAKEVCLEISNRKKAKAKA